jgi:hypothetical protein
MKRVTCFFTLALKHSFCIRVQIGMTEIQQTSPLGFVFYNVLIADEPHYS